MNIGIFAGTFDPVHNGHTEFARSAINQVNLDKVIIVAEKEPYRKKPHASWDHRQAMIERATESIEQVDHDYQFAAMLSHQHTMKNMLTAAKAHYGKEHSFWFLVGSDLFEHMHQWHDLIDQSQYGGFVVALRDDHSREWVESKCHEMEVRGQHITIKLIENTHPHVSSGAIRAALKVGEAPIDANRTVIDYAEKHYLYL